MTADLLAIAEAACWDKTPAERTDEDWAAMGATVADYQPTPEERAAARGALTQARARRAADRRTFRECLRDDADDPSLPDDLRADRRAELARLDAEETALEADAHAEALRYLTEIHGSPLPPEAAPRSKRFEQFKAACIAMPHLWRGLKEPIQIVWNDQPEGERPEMPTPEDVDLAERRRDSLTDADLAARFATDELTGRFCWNRGLGWQRYDGRRWARQDEETVTEVCRRYFVRLNETEAARLYGQGRGLTETEQKYLRELNKRLDAPQLAAVVRLSRGIVKVDADRFDARPDLLNVGNGVVHLPTGELRPHDPGLYLTRITDLCYRPDADHDDLTAVLGALPEDVLDWFQERLGQAATGHTPPDDLLAVLQGGGENGKSTLLGCAQRALGEHAITVSDRVLLANDSAHPTERMELRGARFAVIEEVPGGHELNMNKLKKIVGTPRIEARYISQNSVTFDATHALFITTNDQLVVRATDHGSWRRLALVRFPYRYRKAHELLDGPQDRRGDGNLRYRALNDPAVLEAMLAWIVDGAHWWYLTDRQFLALPETVERDTATWRRSTDLILGYVEDALVFDPTAHVLSSELHADFVKWLGSAGHGAWTANVFKARFTEHSAVRAAGLTTGRTRRTEGLSRPSDGLIHPPLVNPQNAVFGLRFRRDGEADHLSLIPPVDPLASHGPAGDRW
jgi:putative DNA primase/helicase